MTTTIDMRTIPDMDTRLTDTQRDALAAFLVAVPRPDLVLRRVAPRVYDAARLNYTVEECHSAALWGCVKAAAKYDPRKGMSFGRYSQLAIQTAIRSTPWHRRRRAAVLDALPAPSDTSVEDRDDGEQAARLIRPVLAALTPRQRLIVRLLYWEGYTITGAANALQVRKQAIDAARTAALRTLKDAICHPG